MAWNYRILKDSHGAYRLVELYQNDDGAISGWCEVDSERGETIEELKNDLQHRLEAFDAPILSYEDLPSSENDGSKQSTGEILDKLLATKGLSRDSLRVRDFTSLVLLELADGSSVKMYNAFAIQDGRHIGVFTEHNGHHLFFTEDAVLRCSSGIDEAVCETLDEDLLKRLGLCEWNDYELNEIRTVRAVLMDRIEGILCRSGDEYFLRIQQRDADDFVDVSLRHSDPDVVLSGDLAIYRSDNGELILDHSPKTLGYRQISG